MINHIRVSNYKIFSSRPASVEAIRITLSSKDELLTSWSNLKSNVWICWRRLLVHVPTMIVRRSHSRSWKRRTWSWNKLTPSLKYWREDYKSWKPKQPNMTNTPSVEKRRVWEQREALSLGLSFHSLSWAFVCDLFFFFSSFHFSGTR